MSDEHSNSSTKLKLPFPYQKIDGEQLLRQLEDTFLKPKLHQTSLEQLQDVQSVELDFGLDQLNNYLSEPLLVGVHNISGWNSSLASYASAAPSYVDLALRRGLTGEEVIGYHEVPINQSTAQFSTSSNRALGQNFIKGSLSQLPFIPGGLESSDQSKLEGLVMDNEEKLDIGELLATLENLTSLDSTSLDIPGLDRTIRLADSSNVVAEENQSSVDVVDIANILSGQDDELMLDIQVEPPSPPQVEIEEPTTKKDESQEVIDSILPTQTDIQVNPLKLREENLSQKVWAHSVKLEELPGDYNQVVQELAHPFPFELDPFQKHAVYHLEAGDSVFIAAHTSAGKTVVAEYAIALANRHMTRAIYTSPIKALSNQKFRDFKNTFEDVGILTGDVQINPEATCLIMTTEILRSMLYRGADVIRDVEFVIFDEVHYLNDADRGVVWEEVLIMLPAHISIILLSATVPNTMEFAEWIGRTKKKNIFVISTLKRPTPLEHHLYANKELFKIVDERGLFLDMGWRACKEVMIKEDEMKTNASNSNNNRRGGFNSSRGKNFQVGFNNSPSNRSNDKQEQTLWTHMIGFLKKKNLLPVIVFTFSKRRCDINASNLPNLDLNTNSEKSEVKIFLNRASAKLPEVDRQLPQLQRLHDLLLRGIGVHHSGLLPIIKEMVEILFSRGLVKVLFATETFAMGVNMPARSVVFNGLKKHDGVELRYLLPGEYTQMSGRAGRRGLDKVGTVIIVDSSPSSSGPPDQSTLRQLILGKSTKLASQFRLTYNMILNLLRVEALKVEEMIQRSFAEDASQQQLPHQEQERKKIQEKLDAVPELDCGQCNSSLTSFITTNLELRWATATIVKFLDQFNHGELLSTGRVVIIDTPTYRNCVSIIVRPAARVKDGPIRSYLCLVLTDNIEKTHRPILPYDVICFTNVNNLTYAMVEIEQNELSWVTDEFIKIDRTKIMSGGELARLQVKDQLVNLAQAWSMDPSTIPFINHKPRASDLEYFDAVEHRDNLLVRLHRLKCNRCPDLLAHYALLANRRHLTNQLLQLSDSLSGVNLDLIPEYHQRLDVMTNLGFCNPSTLTITLKGRVACEINSVNECVLTELILNNFFGQFDPEESVALLSCFLFKEKTRFSKGNTVNEDSRLTPRLVNGCEEIWEMCYKLGEVQAQCGLMGFSAEQYCDNEVNFGLVGPVYEWARGMTFKNITLITDVAEGSIVRCITRLDDTCRDVRNAARLMGDSALYTKMEEARLKVQRDIVFAASLYI